jgi:GNAT superfamily N-acetyltransferase
LSVPVTAHQAKTKKAVQIRPASAADEAQLCSMYESFEPRPASLGLPPRVRIAEWLERLSPSPNFLAIVDDRLVGHAVLCPDGDTAEVAVFVHQDYRNRGIGHLLLETLVEQARQAGMRRVWGMTELDNIPMLRLAKSLGFAQEKDPCMFAVDLPGAPKR